ncbi:unnamed protein product [Cuscuta campestris]|uniref:Uncharacterized protein n=1 Tax=Cuscuta campestris TaxID=132261 RepID=A0A484NMF0_9ASTE|nr:unnamed protein product [Cuscuta campestris]
MVRAPCCEKIGLKRGPWSPEEDHLLVSYIHRNGHGNWRALPKKAGLLRCGKSCRLRWINYLSPEIKRGNFSKEEEDTIIHLHQLLGNRWSAIAAKLPGRTDNEIKNVWHTHLKKRLPNYEQPPPKSAKTARPPPPEPTCDDGGPTVSSSSSESFVTAETTAPETAGEAEFSHIAESFWTEVLCFPDEAGGEVSLESRGSTAAEEDGMDFWYDLLSRAGELSELMDF